MTKQKTALAGLIVVLVSLSACRQTSQHQPPIVQSPPGSGHHHGQEQHRVFEIAIFTDQGSHACFADFPAATVWKSKAQTVTWFSDDSDYRVHFMGVNGSPFTGPNPLVLPANGSVPSGALRGNVSPGYNEYTLENSSGTPCNTVGDPGIYVKP